MLFWKLDFNFEFKIYFSFRLIDRCQGVLNESQHYTDLMAASDSEVIDHQQLTCFHMNKYRCDNENDLFATALVNTKKETKYDVCGSTY